MPRGWNDSGNDFVKKRAVVIGNGAQGLAAAWKLLDTGMFEVEVVADKAGLSPPNALWEIPPYNVQPEVLVTKWAKATFGEYLSMRESFGEDVGVCYPVPLYALTRNELPGDHPQKHNLANYRHGPEVLKEEILQRATAGTAHEIYKDAEAYDTITVNTRKNFAWLRKRIQELGGRFSRVELKDLSEAWTVGDRGKVDLVVNCTGMGAYDLAKDKAVKPIKGQVVHVSMDEVRCAMSDYESRSYAIPADGEWLEVGGTSEEGVWDRAPDQAILDDLVNRASEMLPRLKEVMKSDDADVWTGLRPGREGGVRFGIDKSRAKGEPVVIHCYGHGGAGVITSLGCANDVAALAIDALQIIQSKSKL
ncbi:D-amino-acid oxidase [Hondaea fermentalgiana]|uniref:D-amino-acid oxidase n=1 Tax=Hondaea fermentalgiana TaxID=2315210 RepID=A0A2R5GFJ3_9STRA|nr:D-amino-acid oxidase [Hondaea fermentalgiana]|eukprot:GBG29690.1 D-amino-acid oxidase [Hondaea fermentalgiana]